MAETITVQKITHTVPLVKGDCPECGCPAAYNYAGACPIILHDEQADHDACPVIVTQRAFAQLLADAAEQLERLAL